MPRKKKLIIQWCGLDELRYAKGIHRSIDSGETIPVWERDRLREAAEEGEYDRILVHTPTVTTLSLYKKAKFEREQLEAEERMR